MEKETKVTPRLKPNFGAEEIAHIALKVRTDDDGNTIKEHTKVLGSFGTVLLGKMGQRIGEPFLASLNDQIARHIRTNLFLIIREGWNGEYVAYQCLLRQVSYLLKEEKKPFVPKYYAHKIPSIKTWFEIVTMERMSREQMNRIYVLSSNRSIMSVVSSSATMFRVGIEKSQNDSQLKNDGEKNES
jgi:hypothetical protein